jgi:tRNA (guanine-N7-)-methyltransferase
LLGFAAAHPEHNVLGVEVRQTLVTWINGVIDGEHLPNARAVWYTLANGLEWIAPESIQTAFYLFPDPWPKKRHYKRRAFTPDFVRMITRVLAPGGRLYLATDRPEVDAYQTAVIEATGGLAVSPLHEGASWPFEHRTDQQRFCDRKDIPYAWRFAQR